MYTCETAKDGEKLSSNMSPLGKPVAVEDAA